MRERSHRPDRKYAAIPNHMLRDRVLSMESRGLLALLMTYADDWQFVKDHLLDVTGWGRDKFERVMGELISNGYVERVVNRDESGRLAGSSWVIRDDPTEALKSPVSDATEALKNRPPVKPTPGESAPKKTYREEDQSQESFFASEDAQKRDVSQQKPNIEEQFERFWKIYPRKIGKGGARAKFAAALKRGTFDAIMAGVQRYAAHIRQAGTEEKFIAHAATWLHQERWTDALPDAPAASGLSQIDMLLQQAMIEDRLNNPAEARRLRAEARKLGWQG